MTIDELIAIEISEDVFTRWLNGSWHKDWIIGQVFSGDMTLVEAARLDAIEDYRAHRLMMPDFIAQLREINQEAA